MYREETILISIQHPTSKHSQNYKVALQKHTIYSADCVIVKLLIKIAQVNNNHNELGSFSLMTAPSH